jgi:hypothetical protein
MFISCLACNYSDAGSMPNVPKGMIWSLTGILALSELGKSACL